MASRQALVIGFGSVGARHAAVLEEMGFDVNVVSRRAGSGVKKCYSSVTAALAHAKPDYTVIATETASHFDVLRSLREVGMDHPILVEKPLFEKPRSFDMPISEIYVGYQLRFHLTLRCDACATELQ
jgi:predicted dehydrogenase